MATSPDDDPVYDRLMNRRTVLGGIGAGAFMAAGCSPSQPAEQAASADRPNVLFIMLDDLGYGDLSCYGSADIATPHVDGIGEDGMTFRQAYAGAAVCTPSRAALLTGRYAQRVGLPEVIHQGADAGLPAFEYTIADALRGAGYATGIFGKWHLGDPAVPGRPWHHPDAHGFDRFVGIPYSNDMDPLPLYEDRRVVDQIDSPAKQEQLASKYTDAAINFIRQANAQGKPFFAYLPHSAPHQPFHVPEPARGKSGAGLYGDLVQVVDQQVGRVLDELRANGLEESTLVVFTSDNGPWFHGSAGGLRGRKTDPFEGGVRVPLMARWPGHIPRGESSQPISFIDMLPTLAGIAGANPRPRTDRKIDGIDITAALHGQTLPSERALFYYGDFSEGPRSKQAKDPHWTVGAVRRGRWKLLRKAPGRPAMLFDIDNDGAETTDVLDRQENQQVVAGLRDLADGFDAEIAEAKPAALARACPNGPGR